MMPFHLVSFTYLTLKLLHRLEWMCVEWFDLSETSIPKVVQISKILKTHKKTGLTPHSDFIFLSAWQAFRYNMRESERCLCVLQY